MRFVPVEWEGQVIGYEAQVGTDLFFFGTQAGELHLLKKKYPQLTFRRLQQVHGDHLVRADEKVATADAHWTDQTYEAPLVATADCLPVLISHAEFVCAVHAGWRGIKNEIVMKSLEAILGQFGTEKKSSLRVCFGPHIQQSSFEVDLDLAHQFQEQYQTYGGDQRIFEAHPADTAKAFVNLAGILLKQLHVLKIPGARIAEFSADTKIEKVFASFRRDKENARRNFSFVARLKT